MSSGWFNPFEPAVLQAYVAYVVQSLRTHVKLSYVG